MTKRLLSLAITLFLALGLAVTANAQPFAYITAQRVSVVVLNLANNSVVATISGSDAPDVNKVAITPDGSRALVTAGNSLLVINTVTNKITTRVRLGSLDDADEVVVSPDGRYAYVTGSISGNVWAVDLDRNVAVATISVGGKPAGVAVMPDGSRVYVAGCGAFARSLCVVDAAKNAITAALNISSSRLVITPDGTRVYIATGGTVTVLNTATNTKVATVNTGLYLGGDIAIAPNGKYVYVGGIGLWGSSMTAVIDTTSNKVIATVNAGGFMAISPDGKRVYLLDALDVEIWIINTETNAISDKIRLPGSITDGVLYFKDMAITPGPRQKPVFSAAAVVNAAGYQAGSVAPGEIVTIFGPAIGPPALTTLRLTPAGLVDNLLAETRILFDGIPAPLIYVWQNQNSTVVPYAVAGKSTTQVQIEYKGLKSEPVSVRVVPTVPGIFTLDSSGKGQAAALNENMTINSGGNPALRGSIVVLYATGEGQTSPPGVDGKVASDVLPKPLLPVSVQIGGVPAEVLYAGAAPGLVAGVLQVNVRVPLNGYLTINPDKTAWVGLTVGNASSQQGVTIAVK